jgi:acetoin utilization deacetylase AcuC-like enzyme
MRVVFHEAFHDSDYSEDKYDNAADPGRLLGVMQALRNEGHYAIEIPAPAKRSDLLLGHTEAYVDAVERTPRLYAMASLAAGAAIAAADIALRGEPMFACVRPPGHHASRASAWGHCTFSNVALALLRLRSSGLIRSATLIDFDAHTGDGTKDVLRGWPEVQIYNGYGNDSADYLRNLDAYLKQAPQTDILAVSAGFDAYVHDLGHKLYTEDFFTIGRLLQGYAIRLGHQRRFAVLEGGYYLPDLGKNVLAFCRGFE